MERIIKRSYLCESEYVSYIGYLSEGVSTSPWRKFRHISDHFNLITSGSITITVEGTDYTLSAGSMVFFPQGLEYTAVIPKKYSQISIEMEKSYRETWSKCFPESLPENFEIRHIPYISENNFYELRDIMLYNGEIEKAQAKNIVERYILAFLFASKQNDYGFKEKFSNLIIESNPCKLTLTQIADKMHYSKTHTERLMRKTFGCSVSEYLHKARLAAASELLISTDTSIAEIAEQTGFYDASHFSSAFKKETGISPREYRNKMYNN